MHTEREREREKVMVREKRKKERTREKKQERRKYKRLVAYKSWHGVIFVHTKKRSIEREERSEDN